MYKIESPLFPVAVPAFVFVHPPYSLSIQIESRVSEYIYSPFTFDVVEHYIYQVAYQITKDFLTRSGVNGI
jgi:hypothetical protein